MSTRNTVPVPAVCLHDRIVWAGHTVEVVGIAERSNGRRFQIIGDPPVTASWVHYFNDEHVEVPEART